MDLPNELLFEKLGRDIHNTHIIHKEKKKQKEKFTTTILIHA